MQNDNKVYDQDQLYKRFELMLEMLELALVMLFFMSFAKISSDVADKGEFKSLSHTVCRLRCWRR